MTPGRLVAPMSVRRDFQASPQWFANNPGAMDAVGNALLDQNQGTIQSWVQSQRQNARNADMQMWTNNLVLPGITAQYWNYAGTEILRLIATPENAAGTVPASLTIAPDSDIDVKAAFNGWSIPGGEPTIKFGEKYFTGDFGSSPGWWDIDGPVDVAGSFWEDYVQFGPFDGLGDPLRGQDHAKPTKIEAGTKVCTTPLRGKVYWEVEILEMPSDVPGSVTEDSGVVLPNGFDTVTDIEANRIDTFSSTRFYPQKLNTWMTPAVGVVPEYFLAPSDSGKGFKSKTPALIGQDKDMYKPRSVGVTRTSYMVSTYHEFFRVDEGAEIWSRDDFAGTDFTGTTPVISFIGSVTVPRVDQKPGTPIQVDGQLYTYASGDVFLITDSATGEFYDSGGPPPCPFLGPRPLDYSTAVWDGPYGPVDYTYLGKVGGSMTKGPVYGPYTMYQRGDGLHYPDIYQFATITITKTNDAHNEFTHRNGLTYIAGDIFSTFAHADTPWPADELIREKPTDDQGDLDMPMPPGSGEGYYAPVFMGRWDFIADSYADDGTGTPIDGSFFSTGVWTGVDVGALEVGDRLRFAYDETTRKLYIGKNEKWFRSGGKIDKTEDDADPAEGQGHVVILDVDPDTGTAPNYYAAVSWRVGPLHAKIHIGVSSLKFPLPKGFGLIPAAPAFTIPLPDTAS